MTEHEGGKEKWASTGDTISVTGTDHNHVVRVRLSGYIDGISIYGIYPGMSLESAENVFAGKGIIYQGRSEDGWLVYSAPDGNLAAYNTDDYGQTGSVYVAAPGYLPISYN